MLDCRGRGRAAQPTGDAFAPVRDFIPPTHLQEYGLTPLGAGTRLALKLNLTFPLIESLERSAPSAYRTNADSVTWRITFTEVVTRNVDPADFVIIGIQPWSLTLTKVNDAGSVYEVNAGQRCARRSHGTVALALSASRTIKDLAGNDLVNRSLSGDVEFVIDNTGPTVTIDGVPTTDSGSFMATFTFSEDVTGWESRCSVPP